MKIKVKMLKDNKVAEVNESYGARLIEQGKAVPVHKKQEDEGKPAKKTGKGG